MGQAGACGRICRMHQQEGSLRMHLLEGFMGCTSGRGAFGMHPLGRCVLNVRNEPHRAYEDLAQQLQPHRGIECHNLT